VVGDAERVASAGYSTGVVGEREDTTADRRPQRRGGILHERWKREIDQKEVKRKRGVPNL
jgi:hypothetical protein